MTNEDLDDYDSWLVFHDGLQEKVDPKRIARFEERATMEKFYQGTQVPLKELMGILAPYAIDFSDVHPWGDDIPDTHENSARLFQIWAEDQSTGEIELMSRGHLVLFSAHVDNQKISDYYELHQDHPYFCWAMISNFKTKETDYNRLRSMIRGTMSFLNILWKDRRERLLRILDPETEIAKRISVSYTEIMDYIFMSPSMDRELLRALHLEGGTLGGIYQLVSLSSKGYQKAILEDHIHRSRRIAKEYNESI